MTITSTVDSNDSAISEELPKRLADLVGDVDSFFADLWRTLPQSFRCQSVTRLISASETWSALDCGLLVSPYFSVMREGVPRALADITVTRDVLKQRLSHYPDAAAIRECFASGHTVTLPRPEHWHSRIREMIVGLRADFRAELQASVFLSPPDTEWVRAHTDNAHMLVLQLDGERDWVVGLSADNDGAGLRRSDNGERHRMEVTLGPGDVLYIPQGCPYHAIARGCTSLHLAVTVQEPTARDLAELALAGFLRGPPAEEIAGTHHAMPVDEKVAWLRAALAEHLSGQDIGALVDLAVRIRRGGGAA